MFCFALLCYVMLCYVMFGFGLLYVVCFFKVAIVILMFQFNGNLILFIQTLFSINGREFHVQCGDFEQKLYAYFKLLFQGVCVCHNQKIIMLLYWSSFLNLTHLKIIISRFVYVWKNNYATNILFFKGIWPNFKDRHMIDSWPIV